MDHPPDSVATAVVASLMVASPASAHGYVSAPPSRQALCASGKVKNCGDIQYEPQSVEGPKGLRSCSGGNTRIASFNGGGKQPPASVSHSVSLGSRTGKQKVLAIWNIADTANAFYACIDLQVS